MHQCEDAFVGQLYVRRNRREGDLGSDLEPNVNNRGAES